MIAYARRAALGARKAACAVSVAFLASSKRACLATGLFQRTAAAGLTPTALCGAQRASCPSAPTSTAFVAVQQAMPAEEPEVPVRDTGFAGGSWDLIVQFDWPLLGFELRDQGVDVPVGEAGPSSELRRGVS
jgi:hypothetical protein